MSIFGKLSVVFAVVGLVLVAASIFLNEALMLIAAPIVVIAVYLDHLYIEQSLREFSARTRSRK